MEKIKGFSIELNLDHMKVDSGLKDLKSSMRLMNSEMRSNMSAFSYGEKSLKKYGVQLDGLNKKYQAQEKVVESARKTYEKMVAEHGEGSKQAQKAAADYNHESASLNNLERHISSVTKEMKAFAREQQIQSSALYKTGDALQNFGNNLDDLSSKARTVGGNLTRYLTVPITGMFSVIGGLGFKRAMDLEQMELMMNHMSDDAAEYEMRMDNVLDLVEGTRFKTADIGSEYAKFIGASSTDIGAQLYSQVAMNLAAFKNNDQLIPQIGDLFTKSLQSGKIDGMMINQFTNAGVDIIKVLGNKWGMETEEVRDKLSSGSIDINDVLDELSEGILEGTEGELGVTKAMGGMLEKSGETLGGKISNFWAYLGIAGERVIKETGMFDSLKDSLDEVTGMFEKGDLDNLLIPTFQGVTNALEAMVDVIRKVYKWFSSLSDETQKSIGKFVGFLAVIGPIITGLGIFGGIVAKISVGLGSFLKFLAPITKGFGLFGGAASSAGGSVTLLSRGLSLLGGPIGVIIGVVSLLVTAFITAYKKSDTFRESMQELGRGIKETFFQVVEWVKPGIAAIKDFFAETVERFNSFKQSEGPQLAEAFENIMEKVMKAFGIFQDYITFMMPFIETYIKNTWDGIKTVITGALDLIMGSIKLFSGLFTGDWSKMWEGILDIGMGMIGIIWGFIKMSFFGQLISGVIDFAINFVGKIREAWENVKETFVNKAIEIYEMFKNSFIGKLIISIVQYAIKFKSEIKSMWEGIKQKFIEKINEIYNNLKDSFIGRIITNIIDFSAKMRARMREMWEQVKLNFTTKIAEIRNSIANSFVGRIISSATTLKTRFVGIVKEMWAGVKKQFNNIVDGAKGLPKRIGDGISGAKSKATAGMVSVGNSIISAAGKPFNKVVDGVNWITGKLGVKGDGISPWKYPQYAKGTDSHPGGLGVVGDKFGRELVRFPDGKTILSPDTDTLLNMPKGTQVIPNKITEKILKSDLPHYAKGVGGPFDGFAKAAGKLTGKGARKTKDTVDDVWEYASNPGKLLSKIMSGISITKGLAEIPKALAGGGLDFLKKKPLEFIKKAFSESGGGGKPAFGWPVTSPFGYRIHPITKVPKLHGGTDFGAPAGSPIPSTTGGTVSFASGGWNGGFGNLVKVKQGAMEYFYAHMSRIIARVGQSVKKGDILGHVGSTGASTGPHLHYEARKNGVRLNPMSLKGFKTGGVIKSQMMAMLGEEGEEIVIPTAKNRRTDAMKLLALAARKIGADGGSYSRPGSVRGGGDDGKDDYSKQLLTATLEQNKILMQLLQKNPNIVLNDRVLGTELEPVVTEIQNRTKSTNDRFKTSPL